MYEDVLNRMGNNITYITNQQYSSPLDTGLCDVSSAVVKQLACPSCFQLHPPDSLTGQTGQTQVPPFGYKISLQMRLGAPCSHCLIHHGYHGNRASADPGLKGTSGQLVPQRNSVHDIRDTLYTPVQSQLRATSMFSQRM